MQTGLGVSLIKMEFIKTKGAGTLNKSGMVAPKHILKKQLGPQSPVSLQVRVTCGFPDNLGRGCAVLSLGMHFFLDKLYDAPKGGHVTSLPQLKAFHFYLDL